MKVRVLAGQTLTDIAIQVYGSSEEVVRLATENELSVTAELMAGELLEYNPDAAKNKAVARYYSVNHVMPATLQVLDERIFTAEFDETFG